MDLRHARGVLKKFQLGDHVRESVTERIGPMSDDTYDDLSGSQDPFYYDDTVSQRAMAFCHLARLTDSVKDETVRELCLTMLRKISANVRSPATAELRSIERASK